MARGTRNEKLGTGSLTPEQRSWLRDNIRRRDGDMCCYCTERMLFGYRWQNTPLYASLEHVIRVADGGKNTLQNMKLAHRICNEREGARQEGHEFKTRNPVLRSAEVRERPSNYTSVRIYPRKT